MVFLNVKKIKNQSKYKIEIITDNGKGLLLKWNKDFFKKIKGENITKVNQDNFILQSFSLDGDLKRICEKLNIKIFLVNWSSL